MRYLSVMLVVIFGMFAYFGLVWTNTVVEWFTGFNYTTNVLCSLYLGYQFARHLGAFVTHEK